MNAYNGRTGMGKIAKGIVIAMGASIVLLTSVPLLSRAPIRVYKGPIADKYVVYTEEVLWPSVIPPFFKRRNQMEIYTKPNKLAKRYDFEKQFIDDKGKHDITDILEKKLDVNKSEFNNDRLEKVVVEIRTMFNKVNFNEVNTPNKENEGYFTQESTEYNQLRIKIIEKLREKEKNWAKK